QPIGGEFQQSRQSILAVAGMPFQAFDWYPGLPVPDPAPQSPEIAVMLRHPAYFIHHPTAHQPEVPCVERQLDIRKSGHQPVEEKVRKTQWPWFLASRALRINNVITLMETL